MVCLSSRPTGWTSTWHIGAAALMPANGGVSSNAWRSSLSASVGLSRRRRSRGAPVFAKCRCSAAGFLSTLREVRASDFFTLPESLAPFAAQFTGDVAPWEWLKRIGPMLAGFSLPPLKITYPAGIHVEGPIWLHPTVKLPGHATLIGPAWIGAHTEIRPGAFVRGNVIVGERCVLGNSSE